MSDDLMNRLNTLGQSIERAVDDVRRDEIRSDDPTRHEAVVHVGASDPLRHRRRYRHVMAVAAAVVLVVGGLFFLRQRETDPQIAGESSSSSAPPASGSGLAEQLVGPTWIAVDYPLPALPVMRFTPGESSRQVVVEANDTCNDSSGVMSFKGDTVVQSQVMSTAAACGNPMVAPFADGTTFRLVGSELIVANASFGTAPTRYVAVESLMPVAPAETSGDYLLGTTPVLITTDEIIVEGCAYPWAADRSAITIDASGCTVSTQGGGYARWWSGPNRWTSILALDEQALIVESVGEGFTRLDRVAPGTVGRPTLGAFLLAVQHRTWMLDEPTSVYPSGVRPFVKFAPYEAPDVVPAAYGFDGCGYVEAGRDESKAGAWTPADGAWTFYAPPPETEPVMQPADCAADLWLPFTGASYRLLETRELEMVTADGSTRLFRDAESLPNNDPASNPPGSVSGRWTLDAEGPVIEFDESTVSFDGCTLSWEATSDRTIGFTTPRGCEEVTARSLLRFVQLVSAERPVTVGLSDDLATLYLYTDHPQFTALRFSRVP